MTVDKIKYHLAALKTAAGSNLVATVDKLERCTTYQ